MNELANGDGFAELFPRQHRMAGALGLSFDDGLHLRSPGMIFVRPQRPDLIRDAAGALRQYEDVVPQALAVEAVISSIVFGVSVPRPTKPHRSKAEARKALDTYRDVFTGTQWESVLL